MRLQTFFSTIAPYLEGRVEHAAAVAALWPGGDAGRDGERLAIYGRFCAGHRRGAVDHVFVATRRAVLALAGEAAWDELLAGYYRAHPMRHWELNENGQHLPGYLREHAPAPWVAELADLEWWEWQTYIAVDDPADANDEGPPRLASTAELRSYGYALTEFLEDEADAPEIGDELVLFFRDREGRLVREAPEPLTLVALKIVGEGLAVEEVAPQVGVAAEVLRAALAEEHARGLLRGTL